MAKRSLERYISMVLKKLIAARPRYTNTTGMDLYFPNLYNPNADFTVLKAGFTVPPGKKILVRNIMVFSYYSSGIANPVTLTQYLYGSPIIIINGTPFIIGGAEKTLASMGTGHRGPVRYDYDIASIATTIVLEGGDVFEAGCIVRASAAVLLNGEYHEISVWVSGVEI